MNAPLSSSIKASLHDLDVDLESLDLHSVALILHPLFPDLSFRDVALKIAEVAVAEGYRYLIWDPPSPADQ